MQSHFATLSLLCWFACASGPVSTMDAADSDAESVDAGSMDATLVADAGSDAGADDAGSDAGAPLPMSVEPCVAGRPMSCWEALRAGACGRTSLDEDFSTGNYNVHEFVLSVMAGVDVDVTLLRGAGAWDPVLVFHDEAGATVYDGEVGVAGPGLTIAPVATGRGGDTAEVQITSTVDVALRGFVTGWHVVDGGFTPRMPTDANYRLTVDTACEPPTGLLTPPNFDESDMVGSYYILPESEPPGLYDRKARCSRGNRLLIQVLYTVATRWAALRPAYAPISFRDLNECMPRMTGDADHATHDDGTHADFTAGCATRVGCDTEASVALANLFVDTGEVCGIIFDDAVVQAEVNPYFRATHAYSTWHGGAERTFMRTVGGHTSHFHVRVKRPDGTCVPL